MNKITYLTISIILLIYINACTGYKPIFSSTNLQFDIAEYSIKGNKKLGNQIYSKLRKLHRSNGNNSELKSIHVTIESSKDKSPAVKNSAGKILEYKIILKTEIILKDFVTNSKILNYNTTLSSSYKVQDQYSETKKKEDKITEDLINKTYQDLLIKMSEVVITK